METVFKPLSKWKKKKDKIKKKEKNKPYVLHIQVLLVPKWLSSPDN